MSLTTSANAFAANETPSPTPSTSPTPTTPVEQSTPTEPTPTTPPHDNQPETTPDPLDSVDSLDSDDLHDLTPLPLETQTAPQTTLAGTLTRHPEVRFSPRRQIGHKWPDTGVIAPGDWNHNGYDDLMLTKPNGDLMYYRAKSATGFYPPQKIGHGWQTTDHIVGKVDWNADGNLDLIARRTNGDLYVYYGNGSGSFKGNQKIGHKWDVMNHITALQRSINNKPAIATIDQSGTLYLYTTNGRGKFTGKRRIGSGWSTMRHLASAGDWNANGKTDFLAIDNAGKLRLYQATTTATGFNRYQIGHGWQTITHISTANQHQHNTHIRAIFPNTLLMDYPVQIRKPRPVPPPPPANALPQPFVYGTLRTGQSAYYRLLEGNIAAKYRTTAAGFDMYVKVNGWYPWAVARPASHRIIGEEMVIKPDRYYAVLASLDRYENYDPNRPISQQGYMRTRIRTGRNTNAWIYEATPHMRNYLIRYAIRIPSGDWLNRGASRSSQAPLATDDTGSDEMISQDLDQLITIDDVAISNTCESMFGSLQSERGSFVRVHVKAGVPEDFSFENDTALPLLPANFTLNGQQYASSAADACMRDFTAPDAFVPAGGQTEGDIIFDVSNSELADLQLNYQPYPRHVLTLDLPSTQ